MAFSWFYSKLRWWGGEDLRGSSSDQKETFTPNGPGKYADLSLGKTHYIFKGPIEDKSAPLVILLHGVSVFSFIWNRFAELLEARGYRVLCFDFYGHGYSSVPNIKYTRHVFEQQLEELLKHLHLFPTPIDNVIDENDDGPQIIEIDGTNVNQNDGNHYTIPKKTKYSHEVYLIGHSMGSIVATEFAAKYKKIVSKVILFNAAGLPVDISLSTLLPLFLTPLIGLLRRTEYLDTALHAVGNLFGHFGHRVSVNYDDVCKHAFALDEENFLEYINTGREEINNTRSIIPLQNWILGPSLPIASSFRFAKAVHFLVGSWLLQSRIENRAIVLLSVVRDLPLLDADHSSTLKQLSDIPVLIIWGEEDGILPLHLSEKFRKHVPHAFIMKIPGSDHAAFLQRPKTSFKMITQFLDNDFEELHSYQRQQIQFRGGRGVLLLKN
jgi:pimeloyl-ACP methyl ester carboxylesterase